MSADPYQLQVPSPTITLCTDPSDWRRYRAGDSPGPRLHRFSPGWQEWVIPARREVASLADESLSAEALAPRMLGTTR